MRGQTAVADVLSDLLRELRLRAGVDITDLARASGLSRQRIWEIEAGKAKEPSIGTLAKLARGLATDPESGIVDQQARREHYARLLGAAGHTVPPADPRESDPLYAKLIELNQGDRERTLELLRQLALLSPAGRDMVLHAWGLTVRGAQPDPPNNHDDNNNHHPVVGPPSHVN